MLRAEGRLCICLGALLVGVGAWGDVSYQGGERTSFPLNDYTTLGQSFTAASRFNILYTTAPTWMTRGGGGFTLSLYDSPRREKLLGREVFRDFADNATLFVYLPTAVGPGSFYWEISDRTGQIKVGLYAFRGGAYRGGCAYFNGVPDPKVSFVSGWRYSPYVGSLRRYPLTLQEGAAGAAARRRGLPQWLWFPEPRVLDNSTRYFRFTFELPGAVRRADLLITADDGYEVWANGQDLGGGGWEWPRHFDLLKLLHPGRNVVAARVYNAVAPAGLILRLEVTTAQGRPLRLISDTDDRWRSLDREEPGWQEPGHSDTAWRPCVSTGDALSDPWFSHGGVRELAGDAFDSRAVLEALRKEPPMRAEAKFINGATRLVINGQAVAPLLFASVDLSDFAADFGTIGCHLLQPRYDLNDVWLGPGKYDFSGWDLHLARLLYGDPKASFLIMVYLAPPKWWMDQHPQELVRYADGTGFVGDIWGGTQQASFASRPWLEDAGAALRAALAHFEASPLRARIMGYHVANGIYGEWHYFGSCHMPDVSAPFMGAFREWARGAYGTPEALSRAWGRPGAAFDDIRAPNVQERTQLDCDLFRDPARSRFVSDYYRFLHNLSADTLLHFARIVKEATGGRVLCGALYCYLMENLWIQEGGHLSGPRVLASPDLDYVSNPYSYQGNVSDDAGNYLGTARGVGGDGAYRVPVASVRLHKKLYISETDTCSCLEFNPELVGYGGEGTETLPGTLRALRRDFAQALGEGVGTWLLELAPGWYADRDIMAEVKRLRGLLERATARDLTPVAQVAAICQPESFFYTSHWKSGQGEYDLFDQYYLDTMNRTMHRLGAPVDILYLDDLPRARDYKLYVFLNDFYLTDQQLAAVKRKVCRNGATAAWLYAPGFVSPTGLSAERMGELMGMRVERMDAPGPLMVKVTAPDHALTRGAEARFGLSAAHWPRFAVTDPQATRLGDWEGTDRCAFAVRKGPEWTSVYLGAAPVPTGLLRNLAASAGVHLYSSRPDIIYANASYLCLIANGAGKRVCHLPGPMQRAHEASFVRMTGGPVQQGDVPLDLAHGDVVIWERAR